MYSRPRVIPCLLLRGTGLVKTIRFKDPTYLGDPRNVVKIFNDKGADELVLLDITATPENRGPKFDLIREIVSEAFMPLGYGGGIRTPADVEKIVSIGIEKVVLNSAAVANPGLITEAARIVGSQSVVVSIDVKKVGLLGRQDVVTHGGTKAAKIDPVTWARKAQDAGAGEILLTNVDLDGTMKGYDLSLTKSVVDAVDIPVVACGGAGGVTDLAKVVREAGASAAAAGSMFVFQGRHRAVLISFPSGKELREVFGMPLTGGSTRASEARP